MSYEVVKVVSNDSGRFVVSSASDKQAIKVMGTGMLRPRYFNRDVEGIEFAEDQLLMLTLEDELAVNN